MKTSYAVKNVEKLLRELDDSRNSLAYLTSIREDAPLSPRKSALLKKRIRYLTHTITAVEHALGRLEPIEQTILEGLFLRPASADALEEVCEACGLERSSVYRYRTRALKKLAAALYGEGEVI